MQMKKITQIGTSCSVFMFVMALFLPIRVFALNREVVSDPPYLIYSLTVIAFAILLAILIRYVLLAKNLKHQVLELQSCVSSDAVKDTISNEFNGNYDPLTRLPSRQLLMEHLKNLQDENDKYALFMINLDFFRSVNNNLGHEIGDKIIVECARRLKVLFRPSSFVARMDGDEFAIAMKISDVSDIDNAAGKILQAMKKPTVIHDQQIYISISIGVDIFPEPNKDADEVCRNAATAVNIVKNTTRNSYKIYTADIAEYSQQKFIIHSELCHALENNEFMLHYQPKIDGKTLKLVGIEALIRWNHPQKGLLYPLSFIPVAEETGIIKHIDEWVLNTACKQLKTWLNEGIKDIRLAVNLSAWQFKDLHLVDTVAKVLSTTNIDPSYLELEITETAALENLSFAQSALSRLMDMGINISIDDFGTGYSSLNYLKHFPISFLKIDKSFVADILKDKNTYSIVKAVIEVAHALNLKVVAEGVESQEQLSMLKALDCDEIQGYLISRPLSVEDIKTHMQNTIC